MFKKYLTVAMTASLIVALVGCGEDKKAAAEEIKKPAELTTTEQKISYIFGLNIARSFSQQEIILDIDSLTLALEDVYGEKDPRLSDDDIQGIMQTFQQEQQSKMAAMQAERQKEMEAAGEVNKKAGEEFLAANATKEGVVSLESGLQYKEITAGTGPKPTAEDTVTVHYRGTLIDGTEFDSSYSRNEPATFPLQNVIPGWTEGLQHMTEGSKYELYIPSDLAYGPGGSGPVIGPNSTLIFEVELIKAKAE
ncbi:MAG: FKBP-type peptidyl-prolyl cis-trans isomerase [Cellvibrionaceae bacterium]